MAAGSANATHSGAAKTSQIDPEHPRNLLPELCRQFYHHGWMTGTGGSVSIRVGDEIYMTPSGVSKERLQPDDLFVQTMAGDDLAGPPPTKKLKKTSCMPPIMKIYRIRNAGAVIHVHSPAAFMAAFHYPGKEFRCTHLQMVKCLRDDVKGVNLRYDEMLVLPIVENKPTEAEIADVLDKALLDYPAAPAVLVRRHGMYVWGPTWQQAKNMCEALDYLFTMVIEMKKMGIDPEVPPTYAEDAYI